jgi:hypothetical protein
LADALKAYIKNNKCTVENCQQTFTNYKAFNVNRHFVRQHKKLYDSIVEKIMKKGGSQSSIVEHISRGQTNSNRFFSLFVATSTFSLNLVENQFWKVTFRK